MKQLTQSEFKKNGKIYKNISSPATSGTQTQVTDLVYDGGVLKLSTDGGNTFKDLINSGEKIQVTELPPASAENVGKIVQFITERNDPFVIEPVQGHWYKCQPVVADEGRYEWAKQSVQNKDYIIKTSNAIYEPYPENIGRMVYDDPDRKIVWNPIIALGELTQLVDYQGNITVSYTIGDNLNKSQEMRWDASINGWSGNFGQGFIYIQKEARLFSSETLTKPLYAGLYLANDLVATYPKITVTSIALANGTSITIPTGYGEAKFYNYSLGTVYSSPIDFANKHNFGSLSDADIEAFRFEASNNVQDVKFDINKLKIQNESGLKPLKDYLGGSPFKNSTFESTENGSSKEDTWKTTDPDTTLLMQHQNDNGHSGFNVSKNFVEVSSTLTTESGISSTSVTITNDTASIKSDGGSGVSKELKITPTEMLFSERPKVTTNGTTSEDVAIKSDLQNYVPTQSELIPLTWRFNDVVDVNRDNNFLVNFTSNGTDFTEIGFKWSTQMPPSPKDCMWYSGPTKFTDVYYNQWGGENPDTNPYRTITLKSAPTGELLTWLKANAVPQGSSTKVYAQVTNENGAVSIRVFENGDADLQNLSVTKDGVTINGKKPLTSIQPLYKHELVIPYSFSVTDPANGTATVNGSVIYHYLSNTGTQITSASAIDDNFMLSGGIGKNSTNTVLLFDVNVTKAGSSITVEAVNASTMGYITGTVGAISDTVMQLI